MQFINATTAEQIACCKEALLDFRKNLQEDTYVELILKMIAHQGFRLVYIPDADGRAAAFIGYRVQHLLMTGWSIYVDDLYTSPDYRGMGYAGALLDYVDREAETTGIGFVHLDSGFTLHNAHRLYLNKGYALAAHHFAKGGFLTNKL